MWNTQGFFFFFPQTIPSWLHISGAKAYYFPNGNLNLLNCLQTRLFHVAQWEKLSALAPNAFLRIPLFPKPTSFGAAASLFHRKFGQEHLLMKTFWFCVFKEAFTVASGKWCGSF